MCWDIQKMCALEAEYPELEGLTRKAAKLDKISLDEERDELGEAAGMWYDYGDSDFLNPNARRNVATALIDFLKKYLEEHK